MGSKTHSRIESMFNSGFDTCLSWISDGWGEYVSYIRTCGTIILHREDDQGFKSYECITESRLEAIEQEIEALLSEFGY